MANPFQFSEQLQPFTTPGPDRGPQIIRQPIALTDADGVPFVNSQGELLVRGVEEVMEQE
ncbi:MAG: hypothetical protein J7D61_07830 [Marichromatium sp.]|nr:hypothetical protein [Marichromatium sp.]